MSTVEPAPRARLRSIGAFAAGAVIATSLSLSGTFEWGASAAPGDDDATYQPLTPCRLLDTRAEFAVGPRTAPIGPGEAYPTAVTGTNGECSSVPTDAIGAALNVTVLGPTAPSFLAVYPADLATPPNVSNLNYLPGAPPTPNKVDVKLSPTGEIALFNAFGQVDVIVDLVGVYVSSSLTELDERIAALETATAALEAADAALDNDIVDVEQDLTVVRNDLFGLRDDFDSVAPIILRSEEGTVGVDSVYRDVVRTGDRTFSRDGVAVVWASTTAVEFEGGADVKCLITDRATGAVDNDNMRWEAAGTANDVTGEGDAGNLAGTETFPVTAFESINIRLQCRNLEADTPDGASQVWSPQITVLFIPNR
ncbi:MAG: hypothetical protein AAFP84_10730 [Actinomycetota bacterium]